MLKLMNSVTLLILTTFVLLIVVIKLVISDCVLFYCLQNIVTLDVVLVL